MSSTPGRQRALAGVLMASGIAIGTVLLVNALTAPTDTQGISSGDARPDLVEERTTLNLPTTLSNAPVEGPSTLVLYDPPLAEGDILEHNPELGAIFLANLAGHFGSVKSTIVDNYAAGDGASYDGVIYVGAWGGPDGDNVIPEPFLTDVADGTINVLWLGAGADQLADVTPSFKERFGWQPIAGGTKTPSVVNYKEVSLPREATSLPSHAIEVTAPDDLVVLATAAEQQGQGHPYAVRSRNLTYVAEVPFGFLTEANHSLVVADLLFDLLDPGRPERHQALVRLEDIGPTSDPEDLRAAADALHALDIPFAFAVYPIWRDPLRLYELGDHIGLSDRAELVEALSYLEASGGTMVMHGVTHQYGESANPDSGVSGHDYELYLVKLDDNGRALPSRPVPEDSEQWAKDRIRAGFQEFSLAGLEPPSIFEFPHYLGSPTAYAAFEPIFEARYERSAYFPGLLRGEPLPTGPRTQYFPYPVHDVYGEDVIPENLGSVALDPVSGGGEWLAADIVAAAQRMTVVRDGVASFFIHPFLGVNDLVATVKELEAMGYEFVSAEELMEEWR